MLSSNIRIPKRRRSSRFLHKSTAEAVAKNEDLLTEILLRLPVKSLVRFKSVSKHWLSLIFNPICNPRFSRRLFPQPVAGLLFHIRNLLKNPEYAYVPLVDEPDNSPPFRSLSFINNLSGVHILQSCNGLFLCGSCNYDLYICHPTTKQLVTLPHPSNSDLRDHFAVFLAFDSSTSPYYKVVSFYNYIYPYERFLEIYMEIYSSETGSQRSSAEPLLWPGEDVHLRSGVFWNGAINFISERGDSFYLKLETERLQEMPMPPLSEDQHYRRTRYFEVSQGHLHLVQLSGPRSTKFPVYEMEKDPSGWFIKYQVDIDALQKAFHHMIRDYLDPTEVNYYAFTVLSTVRKEHDDDDDDSFMMLHIPGIIRYELKSKT